MEDISFVQYSHNTKDYLLTAQLIESYRDVFADGPWNEWFKCPQCQKHWGKKDIEFLVSNKFSHCNTPLVDFWSRQQVACDLQHEITPEASCWLAVTRDKVVGFCWGYPVTIAAIEAKLGVTFDGEIEHESNTLVAYQDEVGVLSAYRGNKVAKTMVSRRLDDFLVQGLRYGIVRTMQHPEPSETFLWYTKKLGYRILARYPGNDGRVVLFRELNDDLKELLAL